ncbi:hypothetical protein HK097_007552 [Rhizophlyctis rosea]|uniref:Myb-like domain-containing protein n=1 Tax=Rhizophlyctis rosea TaxID=64517 RepID=A0AAD5SDN7_9FUNG|nr:hypothetical protein HK097_007552 [Rhizophlyctis rosea]
MAPPKKRHTKDTGQSKTASEQHTRKYNKWTAEEDMRFFEAIEGGIRWGAVAEQMGTRNADGCKKRWEAFLKKLRKDGL